VTWEETIKYIRTRPDLRDLVEKAYFEEDLPLNVERFKNGEEFAETLRVFKQYAPSAKTILDIGSGNGISAVSFALSGYKVIAVEPDPSETIGAGAIRKLCAYYKLETVEVLESFAENLEFNRLVDVVYIRQAMHHAHDLQQFIKNVIGFLKPGGLLFTVRDHVIYDEADKRWFLESHPLQTYYGGENAFTLDQYRHAIQSAGLVIREQLKHYDSVINFFPMTREQVRELPVQKEQEIENHLNKKIGVLSLVPGVRWLYKKKIGFKSENVLDERKIPGRMYSFISQKR